MEQNPMAKYELRRAGGSARNTEGMFTNMNGNAARDMRRAAKRDARPMTYAEMQAEGMARPAPSTMQPSSLTNMFVGPQDGAMAYGDYGYSKATPSQPSSGDTGSYTPQISGPPVLPPSYNFQRNTSNVTTPSAVKSTSTSGLPSFDTTVYDKLRKAALDDLRSRFVGEKQALEEDLQRRGLSASTFGAGRLGDLLGQQERTLASTEADLLAKEDDRQRALMDLYIRMAPVLAAGKKNG